MNLLTRLFLLALMPLAAAPALAQSLDTQPLDGIVAVVDEDVILRSGCSARSPTSSASTAAAPASCRRATCSNGRSSTA